VPPAAASAWPSIAAGRILLAQASATSAAPVDSAWQVALSLAGIMVAAVLAALLALALRQRLRRAPATVVAHDDRGIGAVWIVGLSACAVISFVVGYAGYLNAAVVPAEAYSIAAELRPDGWAFTYPNATISKRLVVPVARPIEIVLGANRGVHQVVIPEFRATANLVAGKTATLWFEAAQSGDVVGICNDHGAGRAPHDRFVVNVIPALEFSRWVEQGGDEGASIPAAEKGKRTFSSLGCGACHSVDGAAATGPTLAGIFGRKQVLAGGASTSVDEAYMRESVVNASAKVVRGYQPVMPDFDGQISEADLDALVAYLKSLPPEAH
jgi:cytochrome c oxidase subunit 2